MNDSDYLREFANALPFESEARDRLHAVANRLERQERVIARLELRMRSAATPTAPCETQQLCTDRGHEIPEPGIAGQSVGNPQEHSPEP